MGKWESVIIHLEATWVFFLSLPPLRWSIIISSFSHAFIIIICSVQCLLLAMLSAVGLCHQQFVPRSLSNHSYQIHLRRNAGSRKTGRLSASSRTPAAGRRPAWEETEEAGETKSAGFSTFCHIYWSVRNVHTFLKPCWGVFQDKWVEITPQIYS